MKTSILLFVLILCEMAFAAPINYTFTALAGTYTANASPTVLIGPGDDDLAIGYQDIGFTFYFGCLPYTGFSVTNNGWMSLDPECTDFHTANNLSTAISSNGYSPGRPILAPLWDDLSADWSVGSVNYKLTGAAGSRILTVEWKSMAWYTGGGGTISFQCKLFEGSNKIEFIYKQEGGALTGTRSASIGLGGLSTGDYYTLNGTGAAPTASKATNTTNLNTRPATNQIYRWVPNCALPINLNSFEGENTGKANVLEWITASEKDNDYFTIEKSLDGTEFFDFSKLKGGGNSSQNLYYRLADEYPEEICYYRLKQTDFNGSETYYETITVLAERDKKLFYPNPAEDFIFIEGGEGYFSLLSATGQLVYSGGLGKDKTKLDISKLEPGIYFLKVNETKMDKIIISH